MVKTILSLLALLSSAWVAQPKIIYAGVNEVVLNLPVTWWVEADAVGTSVRWGVRRVRAC